MKKETDATTARLLQLLKKTRSKSPPISEKKLLSTSSTLLNKACTGNPNGGLIKGHYYLLVGDSDSGKTVLGHAILAQATINRRFRKYRLKYDDVEYGVHLPVRKLFGRRAKQRIEYLHSETVEEFYYNAKAAFDEGPCIYIIDSVDALTSIDETTKFDEQAKAYKSGKQVSGTYGLDKPKKHSTTLRQLLSKLKKHGSILIVINQTRDNIGFGYGDKKTRAGGRALIFYATLQIWTSIRQQLQTKSKVGSSKRSLGILAKFSIKRSRFTGKKCSVEVPIYHTAGIDDIGSCIQYLITEGRWKLKQGIVISKNKKFPRMKMEDLVAHIEDNNLEPRLREIVSETWDKIEESCEIKRKSPYDD